MSGVGETGLSHSEVLDRLGGGVSPELLRKLCSSAYFGDFLTGLKTPQGHRRYTEQDVAVLKYALQRRNRGQTYESTRELLKIRGVSACLADELGMEGQNAYLAAQVEQLRAMYEQEHEAVLQLKAVAVRYQQARALAVTILQDATLRREQASDAFMRAKRQVQDAQREVDQYLQRPWLHRIFAGAVLARAQAKHEEAVRSLEEAATRLEKVSLLELQTALDLRLPGATEAAAARSGEDIIEAGSE